MTPHSDFEVYGEALGGAFLGSGTTDEYGYGFVEVVIPWDATPGSYAIEVCEVPYVACTDTTSDFWVGRSDAFTVEDPAPGSTGTPGVVLSVTSGEAGTLTTVSVSGFFEDTEIEVHGGDYGAGRLTEDVLFVDSIGEASFMIQIPVGTAPGSFTVAVCGVTYVACHDPMVDFWSGA